MKQLELLYQKAQIHFLVHGTEKGMMINATEMAKPFGKSTKIFLKQEHTKRFIESLKRRPNSPLLDAACCAWINLTFFP